MQKRWSLADSSTTSEVITQEAISLKDNESKPSDQSSSSMGNNSVADARDQEECSYPLRKCRSSLDIAMGSLRKEISSLISQDNDLFRQLLSLHDSIAELRERQRSCYALNPDDDEDDEEEVESSRRDDSPSPSLESLSDMGDQETSPDSTLSSRSSLSATGSTPAHHHHRSRHPHRIYNNHHHHNRNPRHQSHHQQQRSSSETHKKHYRSTETSYDDSRPLIFIDRSEICFRCRKVPPPYRRSSSINSLYWLQEDMDSYDSGIHLQGCHSDSDHEIFV